MVHLILCHTPLFSKIAKLSEGVESKEMFVSSWYGIKSCINRVSLTLDKDNTLSRKIAVKLTLNTFVAVFRGIITHVFRKFNVFNFRSQLCWGGISAIETIEHCPCKRLKPNYWIWDETKPFCKDSWQWSWRWPQNNLGWRSGSQTWVGIDTSWRHWKEVFK